MRVLDFVERTGNLLPHPFWLFIALILGVGAFSALLSTAGVSATTPSIELLRTDGDTGKTLLGGPYARPYRVHLPNAARSSRLKNLYVELRDESGTIIEEKKVERAQLRELTVDGNFFSTLQQPTPVRLHVVERSVVVQPRNLLSGAGLRWWVLNLVENFAHFEPLGIVLVMLMGVSVAEGSGLITAVMKATALAVPRVLLTPALFAIAACGNIGSDAGVVVIPPLSAAIYRALGKNPILGLIVGYVGATAGFTANFFPSGTDVLAMSLTNAATAGSPEVNVLANWYFMTASVFFLSILGTFVTHRIVEPRLGRSETEPGPAPEGPSQLEKRAIVYALAAVGGAIGIWLLALLPPGAPLRHPDPDPAMFWRSPFFKGLVPILFSIFVVSGVVYGRVARTLKQPSEILRFMTEAMQRMGPYIVLVLAISQFSAVFKYTYMDRLIAVLGAQTLETLGFEKTPIPFFVAFILVIAVANLFMGSASAKWAIFAPIFVPMFMRLGYHPAFTQLLYRVGDSITNCVSPLYPFFPLLLGWVEAENPEKARVGTVLSLLVPYAAILLVGWIVMAVLWYLLGLPVGPDSPIRLS